MISIILNPTAGNGSARSVAREAEAYFRDHGLEYEILETKCPGDAVLLARKAAAYSDLVISDGGDGTVREVAQGLLGTNVPMGILPGGRGNDFRRSLHIPGKITEALDVLTNGKDRTVDLLEVNGKVCVNVYSIGFDVEVVINSNKLKWLKALAYYMAVFYTCIAYKGKPMHIEINGETFDRRFYLIAFGNGMMYGGGMKVLPNSVIDDGLLDVCLIENIGFSKVMQLLPGFIKGTHGKYTDFVHFFRTTELKVTTPEPMDAQADGEIIPSVSEAFARVLPGALRVRVPAEG